MLSNSGMIINGLAPPIPFIARNTLAVHNPVAATTSKSKRLIRLGPFVIACISIISVR
jgi:hypothetical protein